MGEQQKRVISGPGAADFIAAQGGEDLPETSPDKGTGSANRNESPLTDARNLQPAIDEEDIPRNERTINVEDREEPDAS
jgi:hypothetical protein